MASKKTVSKAGEAAAGRLYEGLMAGIEEMAASIRGEIELEGYDFKALPDEFSPQRIRQIREAVAQTRKGFEQLTGIPSRTLEGYELGRRAPDAATRALLRVIEREPEAVRRALRGSDKAA